jgi:phage/conjugal plasmid C-4 type zinc finger TraR family protein
MADDIDRAQERQQMEMEQLVANRTQYQGVSAELCEECGADIPAARREKVPGVQLCVSCQTLEENRSRHYR